MHMGPLGSFVWLSLQSQNVWPAKMIGLTSVMSFIDGVGRMGRVPKCSWHRQGFKSLSTLEISSSQNIF